MAKGKPWLLSEDSHLQKQVESQGRKWCEIANTMRENTKLTRTPRACEVRWYLLRRQQATTSQQPAPEPVKEATLI